MYCDIPDFGRCCFCLPLRRGVLVFAYINILKLRKVDTKHMNDLRMFYHNMKLKTMGAESLIFGLFSSFMVGVYSYFTHNNVDPPLMYHGVVATSLTGVCVAIYCAEIIFNGVLVFGAHMKSCLLVKIFYYYAITTTLAALMLQIIEFSRTDMYFDRVLETAVLTFVGLCIHLYLIALARSLLKKLDISENNTFDNQLNLVVTGHRVENGVYNNSTMPVDNP